MQKKNILKTKPIFNKIALVTFILIALILFWLFALPRLNGNLISHDVQATQQSIKNEANKIDLPGTLVYDEVQNQGCNNGGSAGLHIYISCHFDAYRLFKNNDAAPANLRQIEDKLTSMGFKRFLLDGQTNESFTAALDATDNRFSFALIKQQSPPISADIIYYKEAADTGALALGEPYHQFPAPAPNEYVYGVKFSSGYYKCETSIIEPPCFAPRPY